MSARIRLRREGARHQPHYRLVVADARAPRDGRFIEVIGHYNPRTDPPEITINEERALLWLRQGALPTDTARSLLEKQGLLSKAKQAPPAAPSAEPSPES